MNASFDDPTTSRNFRRELAADVAEFDATESHLPPTEGVDGLDAFDGVVVTGSRASVYWDEPWIDATREYVRAAIDRDVPTLGVCWGHQLVADALGGAVANMGEYELGYRTVQQVRAADDGGLLDGVDPDFTVFTTHSDEVVELPPGADLLAENDYSVQAFRKDTAFGVQFHPEYDAATARSVTRRKDLPADRIQGVLDGITPESYAAACEAKTLFDNFLDVVRESTTATALD